MLFFSLVCLGVAGAGRITEAAERLTRLDAILAARANAAAVRLAIADTLDAEGAVALARVHENPSLSIGYSKSTPRYHATIDLPLPLAWGYGDRVRAAEGLLTASQASLRFAELSAGAEAEAAYAEALGAGARAELSLKDSIDADSLQAMARTRYDAGDASELDVRLAEINRGRLKNAAAADSLTANSALLELQLLVGRPVDRVLVVLADTLADPPAIPMPDTTGTPWPVASAMAAAEAASAGLHAARLGARPVPSVQFGFETYDPAAPDEGLLPTVGITIPLPLLNRGGGEVLKARAEQLRSDAELARVRRESAAQRAMAWRQREAAIQRLTLDRALLDDADQVISMSRLAYREGGAALTAVLEAQRTAREIKLTTIDDQVAAAVADISYRLVTNSEELK